MLTSKSKWYFYMEVSNEVDKTGNAKTQEMPAGIGLDPCFLNVFLNWVSVIETQVLYKTATGRDSVFASNLNSSPCLQWVSWLAFSGVF